MEKSLSCLCKGDKQSNFGLSFHRSFVIIVTAAAAAVALAEDESTAKLNVSLNSPCGF